MDNPLTAHFEDKTFERDSSSETEYQTRLSRDDQSSAPESIHLLFMENLGIHKIAHSNPECNIVLVQIILPHLSRQVESGALTIWTKFEEILTYDCG